MKKILFSLGLIILLAVPAMAFDAAARVETVGKTLLTKNAIAITGVQFVVVENGADNSQYSKTKVVYISKKDLAYAGNDNEVAAVVADTLGHIISGHAAQGQLASLFFETSQDSATSLLNSYKLLKQNKEADVIAVNLMSNANYNPLALIVLLTKQPGTNLEALQAKPANGDRALNIYEYTNYAYPEKAKAGYACNEYKNFLNYATATISARNEKTAKKVSKEIAKYRKNSVSKISKFKTRGGISGWDALYSILTTESK